MKRYFLKVRYNGVHFHGSQIQGALPTVQLELNKALSTLLRREISTFGASRTDEGVHALCNFYHFDWGQTLSEQFLYRLNAILPSAINICSIYIANNDNANARFDALDRSYRYIIYQQKNPFLLNKAWFYPLALNKDILNETANIILQQKDFTSFSKRNTQSHTFICNILQSKWEQKNDELHYVVTANRFLRGMVRALVSTQLLVARGKITIPDFKNIIDAKDCTKADFSAAGHGLYLEHISYTPHLLTLIQTM